MTDLPEQFWSVARRLRLRTRDALAAFDVTPSQSRALTAVAENGPLRLSALAERLRVAPRSATELADDLESRGLLVRRPDPTDRRATLVSLTPAGQTAAGKIRAARAAEAHRFFAALSSEDQDTLARILHRLAD